MSMDQALTANDVGVASLAGGAVSIAGIATGLSYEVLIAGFAGALCALSFQSAMAAWRRIWTLFTSTLFAGYVAPIVYVWAGKLVPGDHQPLTLLVFSAYLCGIGAQAAIPLFMEWVERRGRKAIDEVGP